MSVCLEGRNGARELESRRLGVSVSVFASAKPPALCLLSEFAAGVW